MCIIVSKEKGYNLPKKEILKNCFENNPDGAGFMYVNNNKVHIEKGFMDFENLYNRLLQLDKILDLKNKNLVLHFRIGTSGKNDGATCHPYPICEQSKYLKAQKVACNIAMVHNGIISNYAYKNGDVLNDTQNFIKDFVSILYSLNANFLKFDKIKDLLYNECQKTKLCFLDKNDNLTYIGDFEEVEGIKYSNGSYKKYTWKNSYKNYGIYDDFYDSYYDCNFDYLNKKNTVTLKTGLYYENYKKELIELDDLYVLDKHNNLYELIDEFDDTLELMLLASNVIIYDEKYQIVSFEDLKKVEYKELVSDTDD